MPGWRAVLCGAFLALLIGPAKAHVTATGLAVVSVEDRTVTYRLAVVPLELPETAAQLLTEAAAGDRSAAERLADALRRSIIIRIDGAACHPGRILIQGSSAGAQTVLEYALHCSSPSGLLELEEQWGELFGPHYRTIATVGSPKGGGEYVLDPQSPRVAVDFGTPPPGGLAGFIRLGIAHILTGYDHLLFLLALLIGAANLWRVLGIATAFTVAHSITLSLAVLGLVHAPAGIVEPLIAASIVWVAVENIFGRSPASHRVAIAFLFGLVHGLGFADALEPLALSGWRLACALIGFNLGVELGQAAAIIVALPALFAIGRLARGMLVYRCASIAVAAAGTWWLVQRVYFG